jgi:hypothetical protein
MGPPSKICKWQEDQRKKHSIILPKATGSHSGQCWERLLYTFISTTEGLSLEMTSTRATQVREELLALRMGELGL